MGTPPSRRVHGSGSGSGPPAASRRPPAASRFSILITCEHAGNRVPPEHARLFRGAARVLDSHRGWDPGALPFARSLARSLRAPLLAVTWTRLLVEANRSPTNPRIWSPYTRDLPREERRRILERYWWPHRRAVEEALQAAVSRGRRVVHIAVHSFTPVLHGEVRNADIGLLYDPARPPERSACKRWQRCLEEIDPTLRVRRNYPYRGCTDGLSTALRRKLPARSYVGLEIELNQALLAGPRRRAALLAVRRGLERALEAL